MTVYSGIPHTTAALSHMRDFVRDQDITVLFTDDPKVFSILQNISSFFFDKEIHTLTHPSELFMLEKIHDKVLLVEESLFRYEGNLESLKRSHTLTVERSHIYEQNTLIENLLNIGFTQSDYRGEIGTYKRDGSIIRIMTEESEWVIEFFDNEVESIIEYTKDIHTFHESVTFGRRESKNILPSDQKVNREILSLLLDFPIILVSSEFSEQREWLHDSAKLCLEYSFLDRVGSIRLPFEKPNIETIEELENFIRNAGFPLTCYTKFEKKLREFLQMSGIEEKEIIPSRHSLESFLYNDEKTGEILLSDDILSKIFIENRVRKSSIKHLDLLLALKEGDRVVHREHGIGRYITLEKKRIGLIEREYMEIEYDKGARLYLPLTELSRITKYVGESDTPLSSLEGKEWEKTMSKTDEEIARIAEEILETDAKRKLATRVAFGKFRDEEATFLKAFKYTHTADQKAIISDIFADMESDLPMDRLVSGDVGFGKTEVAMHAIYKAVLSGMQVAVISPLLILAEEHKETFLERLSPFGIRVESLTRMTKPKEEKDILEKMRTGKVDVVVGTHRLLSPDVHFRRLGLLIIDEEHRFGVAHKEAIKKMKAHIDILSLSATPIPRSLNLALSGLKKISLLTTPPPAKKPIDTIVVRWDENIIRQAIEHEFARGGQVIILHNRIRALPMIEREIQAMLENRNSKLETRETEKQSGNTSSHESRFTSLDQPRIITTHGQMPAEEIENRILDFKNRKYDILLTTTIIENGVNFLGANTIIVSDAEEFGLAQLHQIRGRVGRKDILGKCYLMYRKYELSHEERERLMVLKENSYLGSGYEIAMRDLQIRGAGDILGFRQSGKSKEVGISLYFQLLEEKITLLKTGKKHDENTKIELDLSYVLPLDFFDSDIDKLSFFREIESIDTLEDLDRIEETYGETVIREPKDAGTKISPLSNLFLTLRVSIILRQYGVSKVSKNGQNYHFDFSPGTTPHVLRAFLERFDKRHLMVIVSVTKIRVEAKEWKNSQEFLESLIIP